MKLGSILFFPTLQVFSCNMFFVLWLYEFCPSLCLFVKEFVIDCQQVYSYSVYFVCCSASETIIEQEEVTTSQVETEVCEPHEERKFIVFESKLRELFHMCPSCLAKGSATMEESGSLVKVKFLCPDCGHTFNWDSQPQIGKMAVGNLLMSAAVLFPGNLFTQIVKFLDAMNVARISESAIYKHQRNYLQPTVMMVGVIVLATLSLYCSYRSTG